MAASTRFVQLWLLIKSLAVEPVIFFYFLALSLYQVVIQVGIYRLICYQMYSATYPDVDCAHISSNRTMENRVQKAAAAWQIAMSLTYMIPAIFSDIILGAFGDRHGRKINIMLGIGGLMVALFPLTLVFTFPTTVPMYVLLIGQVIGGLSGFVSLVLISCFAYLADTVIDRDTLTVRMTFFQISIDVAQIIGPLIASASVKSMTAAQMILLCEALLTCGFFACLLHVRHVPPAIMRRLTIEKNEKLKSAKEPPQFNLAVAAVPISADLSIDRKNDSKNARSCSSEIKSVFTTTGSLLKEVWFTYSRPRSGHVRAYLLITAIIVFLHMTAELGVRINVFSLYVQKAPFSWDQDLIGYHRSCTSILRIVGLFVGAVLFKKCLHLSDSTMILFALVSTIAEMLMFAFSSTTWMIFLASALGFLSSLLNPCIKSLIAKLVDAEEVGKSFTAFGIATNVAVLCSSTLYNSVYAATLEFYPGFVFLMAAGLVIATSFLFLWLHIDYHRQYKDSEKKNIWMCCKKTDSRAK